MSGVSDRWAAASSYEMFMGRWSRRLAPAFLSWLTVPKGAHWLDVGCGTGSMTRAICVQADPASVTGCDPSASFIDAARQQCSDKRASFIVAGTGNLPSRDGGYDSIASLLALNFFPDPVAALVEMRSLARPGGVVSACVWDYAGKMELLRCFWDAVTALHPDKRGLDEGVRFPLCQPGPLAELFENGDLRDVRCDAVDIRTEFASFDDYWHPFLGAAGPAPSYVASLDERERRDLAGRLERAFPRDECGRIPLIARAWCVRGIAPGGAR